MRIFYIIIVYMCKGTCNPECIQKQIVHVIVYKIRHSPYAFLVCFYAVRIHFETSSVLIHQLPVGAVKKPENWTYAPATIGECVLCGRGVRACIERGRERFGFCTCASVWRD